MLSPDEKRILGALQLNRIESHLSRIASFDRLSGSRGEEEALRYIEEILTENGIRYSTERYAVVLSNPVQAELKIVYGGVPRKIPAKTRSFSGETGGTPWQGILRWIDSNDLVSDPFLFHLMEKKWQHDLEGFIPCTPILNPIQVLQLEKRGAVASIQVWPGKEEWIHEGINDLVWGIPNPNQLQYYTNLPILVVSQKQGEELKSLCGGGAQVEGEVCADVETGWYRIPQLEAEVGPKDDSLPYVLLGCHLDSWYKGATDNGTGNALVLSILELLYKHASELQYPIKAVFWSGHSNGRYAGSAAYACTRFQDLWNRCIGYINLDMPGLRGATDHTRLASGPELVDAAKAIVHEITGQKGSYVRPVRGWDQSFQNIGVSSFFVWSSTLPPHHPDSTANSFMSTWWHTEHDLLQYYDTEVLLRDGKIYTLATYRLATNPERLFKPERLIEEIDSRLILLVREGDPSFNLSSLLNAWVDFKNFYQKWCSEWTRPAQGTDLPARDNSAYGGGTQGAHGTLLRLLRSIKLLNRLYYTEKESYTQDFSLEQEAIPGLSRVQYLQDPRLDEGERELVRHYLIQQVNRFRETLGRITIELAGI